MLKDEAVGKKSDPIPQRNKKKKKKTLPRKWFYCFLTQGILKKYKGQRK